MAKKKWKLYIADEIDAYTAKTLGLFIDSSKNSANDRRRVVNSGDHFLWKIMKNPNGRGFVSLAVDGDRIVGSTTITRKRIWFKGKWLDGAEIGDTYTDPAYQRQGIFSALVTSSRDRALAEGVSLIYGTPNALSLSGYEKKCSFKRKRNFAMRLWVFPLKPISLLRYVSQGVASTSPFVNIIQRHTSKFFYSISGTISRKCEILDPDGISDFDSLDRQLRDKHDFMLGRGSDDIRFRILDNPDKNSYILIGNKNRHGRIVGFIIVKGAFQGGIKILFLADVVAFSGSDHIRLWNSAVRYAISRDYDLVGTWMPSSVNSFLRTMPHPLIPASRKEIIFFDDGIGSEALKDEGRWRFFILDSDNI